jgi:signal transduction histidine kinase
MQNVFSIPAITTIASVILAFLQALLSALRARRSAERLLPALLAVFFTLLVILLLAPAGSCIRAVTAIAASWAGGAALIRARGRRNLAAWAASNATFLLVTLLAFGLGYGGTTPFAVFRAVGMALLAAAISTRIWNARRFLGAPASLLLLGALWLWMADSVVSQAFLRFGESLKPFADAPALLLLGTSWLIIQEGYPAAEIFRGESGPEDVNPRHSLYARLAATENALAARDRLSASAVLALGAAHEFKNILADVKATAQHGLEQPGSREASLRLILEHAEAGRRSAVGVLEQAARAGRQEPRLIDASRDFGELIRMTRAAFRARGILLESDLQPGVVFRARRNEVEQMLLNLFCNAASAYGEQEDTHSIHLSVRRNAGMSMLEVRDHAGGVSPESLHRLFSGGFSSSGGTGLGLYLSKNLAEANDGMLEYEPTADGSIFRLTFVLVEEGGGGAVDREDVSPM